ncbi:MAG: rhomboid family intramembrane serine protease [Flavobacteriales bacterium]|nr:rhomboid family intramembrane serine protease [Flavobacteriales bacterium]
MSLIQNIKNEFKNSNYLNKLIYLNVFVFLILNISSVFFSLFLIDIKSFSENLMLSSNTSEIIEHPWTLLTYMFLHENFFHLLFNMIWLHFGGKLFLQYLNQKQLLNIYILGGLSGGILFIIAFNYLPALILHNENAMALGASASVLAIVFALATYIPNYKINIPLIGFVKLKYIALFFIILDLLSIPKGNAGGHIAHLGGALFGYIYIKQINQKRNNKDNSLIKFFINIFRPVKKMNPKQKNKTDNQRNIDLVLEKISKSGYNSLNKDEKELLFNSSKK